MTSISAGSPKKRKTKVLALDDVTLIEKSSIKRTICATALGNAMEWYDFGVYAYMATIIGKVFFPDGSATVQLLATFGTLAAAFLMRPIGGIVLGPLGDKLGRQRVLAITMIIMACSSFCVGLIPSYSSIGIMAPILLLILRMVQGFSTGGEFGGAMTYLSEHSPDRIRGFLASWLEFGTYIGYVLAALVAAVLSSVLSSEDLYSWGWRIPFFIAGPIGMIGLYMRMKLEETPAFEGLEKEEEETSATRELKAMVSGHWRPLLLCMGLTLIYMVADYMLLTYLPTYMSAVLHHPASYGNYLIIAVMLVMMVIEPFAGMASDKWGRRPVIFVGCLGFFVFTVPCFLLLGSSSLVYMFLGLMIMGAFLNTFSAVMASTLPALFPTAIRYGGIAVGLNVSTSLFGGTTPLISTWLVDVTGSILSPAYFLMICALIGMVVILLTAETSRKPLMGSKPTAYDRDEAKEVLADHYKDIESQIHKLDTDISEMQKLRSTLADQHPKIN
ncbi:Proline/betaine transporter [Halomonadaceae bacterium LMG 33818]|uniref:glycine betaine/L-proline transporter ProP n=1 Tax=Cernens ardua TaxID=3402176 RepID=UPI003EDC26AE